MSAFVYALVNQKGGIGKTTAAIHLGTGLKARGFKTLIIDMDSQCNLTLSLGGDFQHKPTIMEAILKKVNIFDTIQHLEEVDIIPGSSNLSTIELLIDPDGKEFFLADAIEPLKSEYDFIVIDAPPVLSLVTVGIMSACNGVIIPVGMDLYSFQGTGQLYRTYSAVKQYCNPDLEIEGILITQNAVSIRKMLNDIVNQLNIKVFDTAISSAMVVKRAVLHQQSLFKYAPESKPALAYSAFIDELLENGKERWKKVVGKPYDPSAYKLEPSLDKVVSSKKLKEQLQEIGVILRADLTDKN